MLRLKPVGEQTVVVFGATSGIGRATALEFARRGARVVVAARCQAAVQALVDQICAGGGEAAAAVADAADFDQVRAVAERAVEAFGTLDTWVHSAAVALWSPFAGTPAEEWRRVIDVNLHGPAYGAWAALPHLRREGRGALIFLSSVEAQVTLPQQTAYSASKHALHAMAEALRMELRHDQIPISVTEIMPSGINTPLFEKSRTRIGTRPVPIGPLYSPDLVAEAVLYAAAHPVPALTVGGVGRAAALAYRVAPGWASAFLQRWGKPLQRTSEPKAPDAPCNLFHHLEGHDQTKGQGGRPVRETSLYTWLQIHPAARRLLTALALGSAAVAATRGRRGRLE